MATGCSASSPAGSARRRPPPRQSSQRPGSSSNGSSTFTAPSQPTHATVNFHGRVTSVVMSGAGVPARKPARPPSILAAAVAGSGVPPVARLKATQGPTTAAAHPAKVAARRPVSGPAAHTSASSSRHSGRASTARASSAAAARSRPRVWASIPPVARRAASETSMPESAPHSRGPLSAVSTPVSRAACAVARPGAREPGRRERGAEGRRHAHHLGDQRVTAPDREERGEEQRPERRGRARHRHAGVVREAVPLGEIPRELEVDPGVVERKAGHAGQLMLPDEEQREAEGKRPRDDHRGSRRNV